MVGVDVRPGLFTRYVDDVAGARILRERLKDVASPAPAELSANMSALPLCWWVGVALPTEADGRDPAASAGRQGRLGFSRAS